MPTGWFVVEPPTAGVLNPLMRRAKMNASGQTPYVGPFAGSLKKPLAGMVGQVGPAGGIAGKLKKCTAVMNGGQTFTGGMGASLKRTTFTGIVTNNGMMSAKMKRLTSASTGLENFTGALGAAIKRAKATIQAVQIQSGTMAAISKRITTAMTGTVPGVTLNSVGTYGFGSGGGPISPTITINSGSNIRLYAIVTVTHTKWLNSYNANKPAATSSVNGVFGGRITEVWLGNASGNRQGSIWLLELQNPTVGAHTVSVDCSASQGLSGIQAQLIAFNGVGSIGTIVTDSNPSSSGPPALAAAALRAIDMHLVIMTHNTNTITFSGDWPSSPGLFVNRFQSGQAGDAKACRAAYLQGDGASKTFNSTNPGRYAIAHIPLLSP